MSEKRKTLASMRHVGLLLLALVSPLTQAAIYIEIDGIPGDVAVAGFENTIEAVSVGYGVSRQISDVIGGTRETSRPQFSEISVLKGLDVSSPLLLKEATVGSGKEVIIYFVTDTDKPQTYYELKLQDTLVSSVNHAFQNDGTPVENVTLNFTRIEWKFIPFDAQGNPGPPIVGGYDLELNKEI